MKKQFQQEIVDRDNEIKELKETLYEEFNYQAEYVRFNDVNIYIFIDTILI